jgi:hypothetical protein
MNWITLIGSVAKLFADAVTMLRDWKLAAANEARGRAASDVAHARAAFERSKEMQQIASKPPGRVEIDKRLEEGSA